MVAKQKPPQMPYAPASTHPSHLPFKPREPWTGPTAYGSEMSRKIRADLKRFIKQKPDKSWAKRVLERAAAGEHIFPLGIEWAQEVAGEKPERVPGEDDEFEQSLAERAQP